MANQNQTTDSRERVALDLLRIIADHADDEPKGQRDRQYWFRLYNQCYRATLGQEVNEGAK